MGALWSPQRIELQLYLKFQVDASGLASPQTNEPQRMSAGRLPQDRFLSAAMCVPFPDSHFEYGI